MRNYMVDLTFIHIVYFITFCAVSGVISMSSDHFTVRIFIASMFFFFLSFWLYFLLPHT